VNAGVRSGRGFGAPTSSLWAVPIADAYDGFLIDLDGVVWIGHEFIPGAGETIAALLEAGKRLVFVTNSPRLSPAEQAGVLRRAGLPVEDDRLVTAGTALIDLARDRLAAGAPLLAIGSPSFRGPGEAGRVLAGAPAGRGGGGGGAPPPRPRRGGKPTGGRPAPVPRRIRT